MGEADIAAFAVSFAATKVGLRPDQVERAIVEYRAALASIEEEPEWSAVMHMSGSGFGISQYAASGTEVTLVIESGKRAAVRSFQFGRKLYDSWSEARAIELQRRAKFMPADLPPPSTPI